MPEAAMIFAAGFGTRMKPLTDTQPKPLIKVAGRALIDHALDLTTGHIRKALVNAHYRADQIEAHLADRDVHILVETPDILDTGGGLKNALDALGPKPVYTLNSDAIWGGANPLADLARHWQPERMEALMMLVPLSQTVGYTRAGNFAIGADGRLQKDASGEVYTGAQIIRTDRLSKMRKTAFSLTEIWDQMLEAGTLYGVSYDGQWADVGTPDGIALAEAMLEKRDV
jgi:MurNAc alpha-1-phosphate uridylyltransferase